MMELAQRLANVVERIPPSNTLDLLHPPFRSQEVPVFEISEMSAVARAGVWVYCGFLDAAHIAIQDDQSAAASWLHAIIHRMEGDYSNSRYWYMQAQGVPFPFDPYAFLDEVRGAGQVNPPELIAKQKQEWNALMNYVLENQ